MKGKLIRPLIEAGVRYAAGESIEAEPERLRRLSELGYVTIPKQKAQEAPPKDKRARGPAKKK